MKNISIFFVILCILFISSCGSDSDDPVEEEPTGLEETIITELLATHNTYRTAVGIGDLTWSGELEKSAQEWANQLASTCDFKHSDSEFGENIWLGTSGAFQPMEVVDSWGSEIENYTYDDNTCAEGEVCGHYTQIVWSNTTEVGCGVASCDGFDIWVCQYNPPGNFIGQKPY